MITNVRCVQMLKMNMAPSSSEECTVSVQVVDAYSDYETGLHQLRNRVKQDHPRYSEFLVYQQRLTENIGQSRRYGDTEARKAERSEIIDRLNELSLSMLDMPFTDLYGLSTSTIGRGPSERLQCTYPAKYGNYCHRPGIPEQNGLCFWHSNLPKTREQVVTEAQDGGPLEGVILRNLDLKGAELKRAWMRGFTAYRCSFDETNLESAWMQMAIFEGCNFINCHFA